MSRPAPYAPRRARHSRASPRVPLPRAPLFPLNHAKPVPSHASGGPARRSPIETRGWRGCGGESSADGQAGNARDIGEASDTSDDGRRFAGAREPELRDAGLTGGGRAAEQRGGAVHYECMRGSCCLGARPASRPPDGECTGARPGDATARCPRAPGLPAHAARPVAERTATGTPRQAGCGLGQARGPGESGSSR